MTQQKNKEQEIKERIEELKQEDVDRVEKNFPKWTKKDKKRVIKETIKSNANLLEKQAELKGFQQGKAKGYQEGINQKADKEFEFLNKLNDAYLLSKSKISWAESAINLIRKRITNLKKKTK